MGRSWSFVLRSPAFAQGVAVAILCALTALVQFSDLRYETLRSSLVPGVFAPHWGASRAGIGIFRDDLSVAVLSRAPGRPAPFLVRDVPNFRQVPAVRVGIEARAQAVAPGDEFWQTARVMLWSYGRDGRRLRYMPYEVVRLEGTRDWMRASLVVPVMAETAAMRVVVAQAGLAGSIAVRGIAIDGVGESQLYLVARGVLIALWGAVAIWVGVAMFHRLTRARVGVAALLALTMAGALAPQPELSDALIGMGTRAHGAAEPVLRVMARWLAPASPEAEPQPVPLVTLEPADEEPQPDREQARSQAPSAAGGPPRAPDQSSAVTVLIADFSPRFDVKWGHVLAFAALAAALPFAFPAARWWRIFAALVLFGVAIEMVQGFSITRSPEPDDVLRDALGAALGLALALAWQFSRGLRKRPA